VRADFVQAKEEKEQGIGNSRQGELSNREAQILNCNYGQQVFKHPVLAVVDVKGEEEPPDGKDDRESRRVASVNSVRLFH